MSGFVGECPFCNVGEKEDRGIKRKVYTIRESEYGGRAGEAEVDYVCGVGRDNCAVLQSYRAPHRQ